MSQRNVRALLMGGQACILYGAAEFSRDIDFAILASASNFSQLHAALSDLQAEVIAVPPFDMEYLQRGHAVHFRCTTPDAAGLRVDVMTKMRGVDPFPDLWERRTRMQADDGTNYDLMALPDLVQAKKTQRDKAWPMIRRLVESDYFNRGESPTESKVDFWLRELRTPELLIELSAAYPLICRAAAVKRPLLRFAEENDFGQLTKSLLEEEGAERAADRLYWAPLKAELEELRLARRRNG